MCSKKEQNKNKNLLREKAIAILASNVIKIETALSDNE